MERDFLPLPDPKEKSHQDSYKILLARFNRLTKAEECNQTFPLTFKRAHIAGSTIKQTMQMDERPDYKYSIEAKIECKSCNDYKSMGNSRPFYFCYCGHLSFLSFTITNLGCSKKVNINISIKKVDSNLVQICAATKDILTGKNYQHAWEFEKSATFGSRIISSRIMDGNRQICYFHDITNGEYLSTDGDMSLFCNIKVLKPDNTEISQNVNAEFPCFYTKLACQFSEANLNNDEMQLSDVILCVGENKVHCHKLVLAMTSKFFERMFASSMKEAKEKEIVLQEIDFETLKSVLTFMYTDVIADEKINVQVLAASDMYEIMRLRKICCLRLSNAINLTNVAETWLNAYQHSIKELAYDAVAFMAGNWKTLIKDETVRELTQKYPDLILTISALLADGNSI